MTEEDFRYGVLSCLASISIAVSRTQLLVGATAEGTDEQRQEAWRLAREKIEQAFDDIEALARDVKNG